MKGHFNPRIGVAFFHLEAHFAQPYRRGTVWCRDGIFLALKESSTLETSRPWPGRLVTLRSDPTATLVFTARRSKRSVAGSHRSLGSGIGFSHYPVPQQGLCLKSAGEKMRQTGYPPDHWHGAPAKETP